MTSDRAGAVQPSLGLKVSLMGFFRRRKVAKRDGLFVHLNGGAPLAVVEVSAQQTALTSGLGFPLVLQVFALADNAKINDPVVVTNAVDVVNLTSRPDSVSVKPCKPMRRKSFRPNSDANVTFPTKRAGQTTGRYAVNGANTPGKNPRLGIVMKQLAQTFCGKIGLSHDALQKLIGQRPGSVGSGLGLRHLSTGGV